MPTIRVGYTADIAVVAEREIEAANVRRSTVMAAARTAFWDQDVVGATGWDEVIWDCEGNQRVLYIDDQAGKTLAEHIDLTIGGSDSLSVQGARSAGAMRRARRRSR